VTVATLSRHTIIVDPDRDNVALAVTDMEPGRYALDRGRGPSGPGGQETLDVVEPVRPGQRIALRDIPAGSFLVQYGCPFAISRGIARGHRADPDRIEPGIPTVDPTSIDLAEAGAPETLPGDETLPTSFAGYRRSNGQVGTRNYLLVIPTSMCASHESKLIADDAERRFWSREKFPNVDGIRAIPHDKGCGCPDGSAVSQTMRVLAAYLGHPNVGGALVIELGCEKTNLAAFGRFLGGTVQAPAKPVVTIGVQQSGGTGGTVREGLKRVAELLPIVNETARSRVSVGEMSLGLKCGGSDAFSGVSANPALGVASDLLVARGGTSILTEVPELFGAEPILYRRAKSAEAWRQLQNALAWYERYTSRFGVSPTENPSPGNKEGGLTNIAIKSLGAVAKAGRSRIDGVIDYAVTPPSHGLWVMQGPGYDQYSTPGLVASGATIVAFTTGRGTTIGNAIAPVFKIASNTKIFEQMRDDLDVNAGSVLDGTETVAQVGRRIFREMIAIASGEKPALAEEWRHTEFQIWSEDGIAL
jgi:arabinonate dehydratase